MAEATPATAMIALSVFAGAASAAYNYSAAQRAAPKAAKGMRGSPLDNNRSSRVPLPLLYGRCLVGVNKTFMHTDNPFLYMLCEIGEGEIAGIFREDGAIYADTDQELPRENPPLVYLDDKLWTTFKGSERVRLWLYRGTADQMPAAPLAALASIVPPWSEALRHTAYLVVRVKYDPDQFTTEPNVTVDVAGLKVLDPATGQTGFSQNPALCAYDMLRRSSERGGFGIAAELLAADAASEAAAYCAAKGWTCNLPIIEQRPVADNLDLILNCFRGEAVVSDRVRLLFRDLHYEAVAMALTEDDVVEGTLEIEQPDITTRPNQYRATYIDRDKKRRTTDITLSDREAIERDGDLREERIDLLGVDDLALAQRLLSYHLERGRRSRPVRLVCRERAAALEGMDLVTLTHSQFGWQNRILRVVQAAIRPDHTIALACETEEEIFYDDTYRLGPADWVDTNLPDPDAPPPGVYDAALAEEQYSYRERTFTRLIVSFSRPPETVYPFWSHAEVYVRIGEEGDWKYMTRSGGNYQLDPVEEGTRYFVRLRSVSAFGTKEDFESAVTLSRMIVGRSAAPGDLASLAAIASGDTVTLFAPRLADPDIVGYEVRVGSSWSSALVLTFAADSRVTIANVKPGTHTFWMAAKDNGGQYSPNPVSASCTVFLPAGFALANNWSWDYSSGTHQNTERTTYQGNNVLKCSHAGGALSGSWTSPEVDLGSVKTVRVFGDFLVDAYSPAGTFGAVFGGGRTFGAAASGRTFAQLASLGQNGRLNARLRWGLTSGSLGNAAEWFHVASPEIQARFVQVVVEIEDAAPDANLYLRTLNMLAYTWS